MTKSEGRGGGEQLLLLFFFRLNKLTKEVLFVSQEDVPILLHWRSGLRKDYRAHLLQK